jgi:tRNA (guanine26-N2/guanine27-N2)-dimethyltransferase
VGRYTLIKEGVTHLFVPSASVKLAVPPATPAFFNPRGVTVRDIAVLACRAYLRLFGDVEFGDPLAGVGAKTIRVLNETDVSLAHANDLNSYAIKLARRSAVYNSVQGRVKFSTKSANHFLEIHSKPGNRLGMIDVDPFGSPTRFVDSALRALQDEGMLSVTATDTAPLNGVYRQVAFRKYFGYSLKTDFSREVGLRLLCSMVVRRGMALDVFPRPVFVHSDQHYMRAYFLLEVGPSRANDIVGSLGYVMVCRECGARYAAELPSTTCMECQKRTDFCGPLWIAELFDANFVGAMYEEAKKSGPPKHAKLLSTAANELGSPPFYFRVPNLADRFDAPAPSPSYVRDELIRKGWKATLTSLDPQGVRTDAPARIVFSTIRELKYV